MPKQISDKTLWYLINIKARRNQTPQHYVDAFKELKKSDPLVHFPRGGKSASVGNIEFVNSNDSIFEEEIPQCIILKLLSYTIVDKKAFYNKQTREDLYIENWNDDIVANKKDADIYFIPSVHTAVVRRNSRITLNNVVCYLKEVLDRIEPEGFDVDVIIDRDALMRISKAHAITRIQANISYSNHNGFANTFGTFTKELDDKLREAESQRTEIIMQGSTKHPLKNEEGGILQSIMNISESNGYVTATVQENEGDRQLTKIDSRKFPKLQTIWLKSKEIWRDIYNTIVKPNNRTP